MSIGEIITTPQGLAVVVEVLPTSFKVGSYTLGQVVAEPLTGGPETVPSGAPAPGAEPLTLYQAIQSQAAALYVASVVETQLIPFARDSARHSWKPTRTTPLRSIPRWHELIKRPRKWPGIPARESSSGVSAAQTIDVDQHGDEQPDQIDHRVRRNFSAPAAGLGFRASASMVPAKGAQTDQRRRHRPSRADRRPAATGSTPTSSTVLPKM